MAIDLTAVFEEFTDEYLRFERIENPTHKRPDLCAFLMLTNLIPEDGMDIILDASYEEIFLNADSDKLRERASPEFIRDLIRCGVRYSTEHDCLCMFV